MSLSLRFPLHGFPLHGLPREKRKGKGDEGGEEGRWITSLLSTSATILTEVMADRRPRSAPITKYGIETPIPPLVKICLFEVAQASDG